MTMRNRQDETLRVLIVDDEEAARYGMRRALGQLGYAIAEAGSVAEARARMSDERPDLLLLDVNLPGESGLELSRAKFTSAAARAGAAHSSPSTAPRCRPS